MSDQSETDRLLMVERDIVYQQEKLAEINETLKEVVKTQHILANQQAVIDKHHQELQDLASKFANQMVINNSLDIKTDALENQVKILNRKIDEEVLPETRKNTTTNNMIMIVCGALWPVLIGLFMWWLNS